MATAAPNFAWKELQIEIIDHIGGGSFATVKKARHKNYGIVAAKIFDRPTTNIEQEFNKEVQQMKRLNHQNIIRMFDAGKFRDKNIMSHTILLEYAEVGSLEKVLHGRKELNYSFRHAVSWLYQIANGVNYLHTYNPKPIVHRDLKPLNLLLMRGGLELKICDFGATCDTHSIMTMDKGTPLYIAPEVLSNTDYNEKCDVFSYGIIFWELLTRRRPYEHKKLKSVQILMAVKDLGIRPEKISMSPRLFTLLYDRIIDVPNKRPTMSLIFQIFEKLNVTLNKTPIPAIIPMTPTTPRNQAFFSSSESLASRSEKSPFTTVVKKTPQDLLPPFQLEPYDEYVDNATNKSPFLRDNKRFSFHENHNLHVNNSENYLNSNNSQSNKPSNAKSHRRTRSYGYQNLDNLIDNAKSEPQEIVVDNPKNINCKSNEIVDILNVNEPLEPIKNHQESERIYNDHRLLLSEDEKLQAEIVKLTKERNDLKNSKQNQIKYQKYIEQKLLLENELRNLEYELNQ